MTQKYAIVPLRDDGGFETAGGVFYPCKAGKITKDQIETMSVIASCCFSLVSWEDLDERMRSNFRRASEAMAQSIGLEVEE